MPAVVLSVPGLTQIENWDVTHLYEAANYWTAVADAWEDAFVEVRWHNADADWVGQARDAALDRADADVIRMRGPVGALRDAVGIARTGAGDLHAVKQRTLSAIDAACGAGFEIREDLAVNAYVPGRRPVEATALQPLANEMAVEIGALAADLAELDQQVAAKISSVTAGVGDVSFTEAPGEQVDVHDAPSDFDFPTGIVVLCEPGPRGGPWEFDCHVFYPGGGYDMYPSDNDDSGGY